MHVLRTCLETHYASHMRQAYVLVDRANQVHLSRQGTHISLLFRCLVMSKGHNCRRRYFQLQEKPEDLVTL